jgi:hypothetical protein
MGLPYRLGARKTTAPHQPSKEIAMRKLIICLATLTALFATATPAYADATAPTNGGNGAGQSGQCSGDPDSRPASCK